MSNIFDILNHQVNGLTHMQNRTPQQQVEDFIKDQVCNDIRTFAAMDDLDKDRLCTLMTQALGRDREYSIIEMPELDEVVTYLLEYINSNEMTKAYDLAEKMRSQLYNRFEDAADYLFDEIAHDLYVADCEESGMRRQIDSTNGEVTYIK